MTQEEKESILKQALEEKQRREELEKEWADTEYWKVEEATGN